jgi:hypothetical protein
MEQSPNVKNVVPKHATMFMVRTGLLLLLLSSAFLITGCATNVPPEDKDFFYNTWIHPDGITPIQ